MGPEEHIYIIRFEANYEDAAGEEYTEDERLLVRTEARFLSEVHRVFSAWLTARVEESRGHKSRRFQTAHIDRISYVGVVGAG